MNDNWCDRWRGSKYSRREGGWKEERVGSNRYNRYLGIWVCREEKECDQTQTFLTGSANRRVAFLLLLLLPLLLGSGLSS